MNEEAQITFIAKLNKVAPTIGDWAAKKFANGFTIEEVKRILKQCAKEAERD